VDVNEVSKLHLTDAPPRRILHVGLDAPMHFTKCQLPDKPIFDDGAASVVGAVFGDTGRRC